MLAMRQCVSIFFLQVEAHLNLFLQLDPPANEPLYLVANHTVFQYLRDYEGLEILGLRAGCKSPVVTISSELIHWLRNGPQSQ